MSIWQRIVHKLGWDYNDLPQHDRREVYSYNAPLPTCDIPGGCCEEMYSKGKHVYPYCEHHYKMIESGINVTGVCRHPNCSNDIINSTRLWCLKHNVR